MIGKDFVILHIVKMGYENGFILRNDVQLKELA